VLTRLSIENGSWHRSRLDLIPSCTAFFVNATGFRTGRLVMHGDREAWKVESRVSSLSSNDLMEGSSVHATAII
jgi:hypothetical protein